MSRLERIARQSDKAYAARHDLSRRGFLMTSLGAGLAFGFARSAEAAQHFPSAGTLPGGGAFEPNIWCAIAPDGSVNVNIIRAEMGQHIGTALARIIADEMEADWSQVGITYVDTDPKWGLMVTGGSWSVWMTWDVFRQAGAAARTVMVDEGAKILGVPADQCTARNGVVSAGAKSISYGDIVARAKPTRSFSPDEMAKLPLKPAGERRLIGQATTALDIPDKTTGRAVYGIDARLPNMLYGRPKLPPTRYGSKVQSVDDSEARKVAGYERYIVLEDPSGTVPGWVVVLATSYPAAIQATDALKVTWVAGDTAHVSEDDIIAHGRDLIGKPGGTRIFDDPGNAQAVASAHRTIEREYITTSVAHYALEPVNALARLDGDVWEIHCGHQWQSLWLPVMAKALQVPDGKVVMRTYMLGGGFGRRLGGDYAIPAALASKEIGGRPVKLVLTRSDDMQFDTIRSPSLQSIKAGLDEHGAISAMQYHVTAGWPTQVMAPAFMAKGLDNQPYDQFALSGADHWYETGPTLVRAISNDLANRTFCPGWLRSVSAGWTPWALECFVDEAAHESGHDPLDYRLSMLTAQGRNAGKAPSSIGGATRQAAVLKRVAEMAGWGRQLPPDTALGLATTFGQEREMPTWTAGVAQVHVDRKTGVVTCQKLWLVLDAGTIVHPDGALAQTQGAALWGLSMALFEGTRVEQGRLAAHNLDNYTPLRIADVPDMDIVFMENTEKPSGLGEPGVTVIAPAIGNAIFRAVGVRLRTLPMRPDDVLAALKDQTHS